MKTFDNISRWKEISFYFYFYSSKSRQESKQLSGAADDIRWDNNTEIS